MVASSDHAERSSYALTVTLLEIMHAEGISPSACFEQLNPAADILRQRSGMASPVNGGLVVAPTSPHHMSTQRTSSTSMARIR